MADDPRTVGRQAWEELTAPELEAHSDKELGSALWEFFGLRGHIQAMRKRDKIKYLLDPAARPTIQAEAEASWRNGTRGGASGNSASSGQPQGSTDARPSKR